MVEGETEDQNERGDDGGAIYQRKKVCVHEEELAMLSLGFFLISFWGKGEDTTSLSETRVKHRMKDVTNRL